jgi:phosphoglycolate phosphatase
MRGVLFDLDGTLVDSREDLASAANAVLAELGLPTLPLDVVASYVGRGARALIGRCLSHVAPGREAGEEVALRFLVHYRACMLDSTEPFPGVVQGLGELAARGVPMGIVTNKPHGPALEVVEALGLSRFFAVVLGGGAGPAKKPAPDGLLVAAGKLGVRPGDCLYVGDSDVDIEAARAASMLPVWCSWGGFQPDAPGNAEVCVDRFEQVVELALRA